MSKIRKIFKSFSSLIMLAIGAVVIILPIETSYIIVSLIIGTVITFSGLKKLFYYFFSAMHMVGGGKILINGIILLDFGLLSFFVISSSPTFGMLYLVIMLDIYAIIEILRALEIKKNEGKNWLIKIIKGSVALLLGILCIVFIYSAEIMALLFAIAWIINGVDGLIQVFKKSSVSYIPLENS